MQDMHLYMEVLKPTTVFFIVYEIVYPGMCIFVGFVFRNTVETVNR